MENNLGKTDKIIRVSIAIILLLLFFTNGKNDFVGFLLLVFANILSITTLLNFCPIYFPFGINSINNSTEKNKSNYYSLHKKGSNK